MYYSRSGKSSVTKVSGKNKHIENVFNTIDVYENLLTLSICYMQYVDHFWRVWHIFYLKETRAAVHYDD